MGRWMADIHILRPEERLSSENYTLNELYGFSVQKKVLSDVINVPMYLQSLATC